MPGSKQNTPDEPSKVKSRTKLKSPIGLIRDRLRSSTSSQTIPKNNTVHELPDIPSDVEGEQDETRLKRLILSESDQEDARAYSYSENKTQLSTPVRGDVSTITCTSCMLGYPRTMLDVDKAYLSSWKCQRCRMMPYRIGDILNDLKSVFVQLEECKTCCNDTKSHF
jgi:hypothetical protein